MYLEAETFHRLFTLFFLVMKQLVLLLVSVFFVFSGLGSAKAQGCSLEVNTKFVLKLSCTTLDQTEFDLNTSVLPFKSEATVRNFCPMASSNYLSFMPIDGTKNIRVTLLQNSTPGRSWTPADWNLFFERNAQRLITAMENTNR